MDEDQDRARLASVLILISFGFFNMLMCYLFIKLTLIYLLITCYVESLVFSTIVTLSNQPQ